MADKKWSYQELTSETEQLIISLMETPDLASGHKVIKEQWAYGVYLGWYHTTMGWQQDSDAERMEALTTRQAG